MGANPLVELNGLGQSVWLDTLSREILQNGELRRLVDEDDLRGVTSNPTIFQKAISGKTDYDESLKKLLAEGVEDPKELFLHLMFEDVGAAADLLAPVYERTGGKDGFVSIEVSPNLAYETEATIAEARRMFSTLGRRNIMVKVPATKEGLPAIEQLTAEGHNINVTLLFSVDRYAEVFDAFFKGIEHRVAKNHDVSEISSVASFFVSRVDTNVDNRLDAAMESAASDSEKQKLEAFCGRAAVANAKLAFLKGEEAHNSKRFKALEQNGARSQRLLWGSTGTKNPAYSDIKYMQELIAPDTVNTIPTATMNAFRDHGEPRITINDGAEDASAYFEELKEVAGIDIDDVTNELEEQGVRLFSDSYFLLLDELEKKRDSMK